MSFNDRIKSLFGSARNQIHITTDTPRASMQSNLPSDIEIGRATESDAAQALDAELFLEGRVGETAGDFNIRRERTTQDAGWPPVAFEGLDQAPENAQVDPDDPGAYQSIN